MGTCLVTGGAGGIGSAICRALARDGHTVFVGYRTREKEAAELAAGIGGFPLFCDVTDPESVGKAVDNVLEKFCQLDILVCNAGVAWTGLTQELTPTQYRRVMDIDLDGVFTCCQKAIPAMISQKSGKIVTISSVWGRVGGSCEGAYSAAKAGIQGLTKALAKELGPSGITVNCVAPGVIDTPMNQHLGAQDLEALAEETPLGRIGSPEDVAGAVAFLCSGVADFVTGQVLGVDGGFCL